mgnify:CR=1 FL=1
MNMNKYERLNQQKKYRSEKSFSGKKRVAAYCRVSTEKEEQAQSFESQCDFFRCYIEQKKEWEFYKVFADLHGIETQIIPLKDDFSISADDYKSLGKAVFIANPNAPTGMALSISDIEKIVASNTNSVVIIDEAYVDFGGESAVNLVKKYDNVLVVRTYSKSRSLAGGRLGFSIGGKEITADLKKLKYSTNPYNINRLTLLAGEASIDDEKYFRDNINKIIENREYTSKELKNMDFEVLPSKTNFVFARSKNIGGERLYKLLKENGILVRHFNKKRIEDFIRVTIGTKEQMRAFVSEVKYILETEAKNK